MMFTSLLFGVEHSPQRRLCVALAIILTAIGLIVIPVQGSRQLEGYLIGIAFTLVGLLGVSVLSRQLTAHDAKVETSAQLEKLSGDFDESAIQHMVDHAKDEPNEQLARVAGQLDGDEVQAVIDQVRGSTDAP